MDNWVLVYLGCYGNLQAVYIVLDLGKYRNTWNGSEMLGKYRK